MTIALLIFQDVLEYLDFFPRNVAEHIHGWLSWNHGDKTDNFTNTYRKFGKSKIFILGSTVKSITFSRFLSPMWSQPNAHMHFSCLLSTNMVSFPGLCDVTVNALLFFKTKPHSWYFPLNIYFYLISFLDWIFVESNMDNTWKIPRNTKKSNGVWLLSNEILFIVLVHVLKMKSTESRLGESMKFYEGSLMA